MSIRRHAAYGNTSRDRDFERNDRLRYEDKNIKTNWNHDYQSSAKLREQLLEEYYSRKRLEKKSKDVYLMNKSERVVKLESQLKEIQYMKSESYRNYRNKVDLMLLKDEGSILTNIKGIRNNNVYMSPYKGSERFKT